jgi:hypothetical protein
MPQEHMSLIGTITITLKAVGTFQYTILQTTRNLPAVAVIIHDHTKDSTSKQI